MEKLTRKSFNVSTAKERARLIEKIHFKIQEFFADDVRMARLDANGDSAPDSFLRGLRRTMHCFYAPQNSKMVANYLAEIDALLTKIHEGAGPIQRRKGAQHLVQYHNQIATRYRRRVQFSCDTEFTTVVDAYLTIAA